MFGFSGLRVSRLGVFSFSAQAPTLPPLGTTGVTLRGLHLLGAAFDFSWNAAQVCAALQADAPAGAALELRVPASGKSTPLGVAPVCVATQAVEVAGVGF